MSTPPIPGTSAYHGAAMQAGGRRPTLVAVAFIAVFASTASCRQILGISDPPRPCSDPLMIDDMEDGDVSICNSGGRQGGWFNFGDGSPGRGCTPVTRSSPTAIPDSQRGASRWAAHFTARASAGGARSLASISTSTASAGVTYNANSAGLSSSG